MIVPNKTVVTYNGRVYGPGEDVPDGHTVLTPKEVKKEIALEIENIDELIDKTWTDKTKPKCKK